MMKSSLIRINLVFIILVLFIPNLVSAETKTFIKEYTYQASEFDSKASCRTIALEQVKRLLLEELGTYLENNTEVKNFELTKDKISALTGGIVQTQVLDEKWDGKSYWLKAEVKADPENVAKSIDNLRKDQKKSEDLEERVKKHDEALKEMDKLRSEMALLKDDIKAKEKYNKSIEILKKEERYSQSVTCVRSYIDIILEMYEAKTLLESYMNNEKSRGESKYLIERHLEEARSLLNVLLANSGDAVKSLSRLKKAINDWEHLSNATMSAMSEISENGIANNTGEISAFSKLSTDNFFHSMLIAFSTFSNVKPEPPMLYKTKPLLSLDEENREYFSSRLKKVYDNICKKEKKTERFDGIEWSIIGTKNFLDNQKDIFQCMVVKKR